MFMCRSEIYFFQNTESLPLYNWGMIIVHLNSSSFSPRDKNGCGREDYAFKFSQQSACATVKWPRSSQGGQAAVSLQALVGRQLV